LQRVSIFRSSFYITSYNVIKWNIVKFRCTRFLFVFFQSSWRLGSADDDWRYKDVADTQFADDVQHDNRQSVQDCVQCHKGYRFV